MKKLLNSLHADDGYASRELLLKNTGQRVTGRGRGLSSAPPLRIHAMARDAVKMTDRAVNTRPHAGLGA